MIYWISGTYLFFLDTIFEDILHNKTPSLAQSNLVPHSAKSLVDLDHDLGWLAAPAQLEQLLPDVASITMDDRIRDTTQKLSNHVSLVLLRDRVESFLNHMTAESVHAQGENVSMNRVSNSHNLFGCTMLKAALNQEVPEAIDHQRVSLVDNGRNNLVLLLGSADLELLLQKDGGLLVIATDNLVDDVLPVASDALV